MTTITATIPKIARRAVLAFSAAAPLLFASIANASPDADMEATAPHANWFRIGDVAQDQWRAISAPNDPNMVKIVRRGSAASPASSKILVVYPRPSPAYDIAMTQILSVFASKGINAEFLAYNFKKNDARGRAALELAEARGFKLIFSMGSESTAWLYDAYNGGALPVISVCSKDPVLLGQTANYDHGTGANFAFTSLNMPVEVQFSYISQVMPDMKNMGILVDATNVSAVETQAKPMAEYARQRGLQVIDIAVSAPANVKAELAQQVAAAVAEMRNTDPSLDRSLFWITGSTAVFREMATINAQADRVPVLSVVPEVVNGKDSSAVLSIGISFESNAHLAAIYAEHVLAERHSVGALPVGIVSPPDIAINFKRARQIGLRVPFNFFESATYIYGYDGRQVRNLRVAAISSGSK